jgi:hypothetical protein
LNVGDTLRVASQVGLTLRIGDDEDTLKVQPATKLTHELVAALKEHKADIVRIVREDEEMRRTGVIQAERQAFELARKFFGEYTEGGGE